MSAHQAVKTITLIADEALAVGQCVEIDTSGEAAIPNATTDVIVGVCAETVAIGAAVPIALLQGVLEFIAGGTITAGQLLAPAATLGRVTGVASIAAIAVDSMCVGIAIDGASVGEVFRGLAMPIAGPHTA